jgi:hypothetical protein
MNLTTLPENITNIYELYRPKATGGILSVAHGSVGLETKQGNIIVLHRTPDNHTHLSSYQEFKADQKVTIKSKRSYDPKIIERANQVLTNGKPYEALTNNCEHLVNYVLKGKTTSEQVKNAVIAAGLGYLLMDTLERPTKTKLIGAAFIGFTGFYLSKKKKLG